MNTQPAARTSRKPIATLGTAPAVKPKLATRPTVIYMFARAAGSGGVYVGKRTPPARHSVAEWPTSGTGRLPCGYGGSGNVIRAARVKHPEEAFSWRILEVVPEGGDYAGAEARWVAWAKEAHPGVCRNLTNGGDGLGGETRSQLTREQWRDPAFRQRISGLMSETSQRLWQDPEYRARASERNKLSTRAAWAAPETRAMWHRATLQKRLAAATKRRRPGPAAAPTR